MVCPGALPGQSQGLAQELDHRSLPHKASAVMLLVLHTAWISCGLWSQQVLLFPFLAVQCKWVPVLEETEPQINSSVKRSVGVESTDPNLSLQPGVTPVRSRTTDLPWGKQVTLRSAEQLGRANSCPMSVGYRSSRGCCFLLGSCMQLLEPCYTKVPQVPAAHTTSVLGISFHVTGMLFPSLSASNFRLPRTEQSYFPFADSFLHPFN